MANCRFPIKDRDGNESVLQQELEAFHGERAALDIMVQVRDALEAGRFGSRKLRANGEPTVAQVNELMDAGQLDPPSATMVNADKMDRLVEVTAASLKVVDERLKRYADPKSGGSVIKVTDKAKRELRALRERLASLDKLDGYLALVQYADKQLREYTDFVKNTFNAVAAAETDGGNGHPAALDEIVLQLKSYEDVFQPELAKDNSTLQKIINGHGDNLGLNRQKEELDKLIAKSFEDYYTQLALKMNNREGLTEEQIREDLKGGKDVTAVTKALGGATQSSSKQLSLVSKVVDFAKLRGRELGIALGEAINVADKALKRAGVKDFGWMLGLDASGKADGTFLQKISKGYWEQKKQLKEELEAAGQYIKGSGLSTADREHNIKVWKAKQKDRIFRQAEVIDDKGNVSDGAHHKFTDAFKAEREKYEELRQDGSFWYWAQKQGVSDEAYQTYKAKYYGEKVMVGSMIKVANAAGIRVPTGELRYREMQFPNEKATTEIREDVHREPRYQALLNDTSVTGKAKLAYYNFFTDNINNFVRILPKEDGQHLLRGELPAVMASVMSNYNTKVPGWTDYMGKVVTNPVGLIKEMLPAAVAGRESMTLRTREDGSLVKEAPRKYTGRFKNEARIKKLQGELAFLNTASKTYAADKAKLEERIMVEQNRPEAGQVETDLSRLLHTFGAMALNYEQLKQQEGTINLLRDAIRNRTFYEEDGKGGIRLNEEGQPIQKPSTYTSQIARQTEDWLSQNYFQETGLGKTAMEQWGRTFKQYVSVTFQGMNYAAALKNITAGNLANRIYAVGRQFGWGKDTANWALKEITVQGTAIAADNLAERMEGNTSLILHPKRSKVDALMSRYGFMEHESKLTGSGLFSQLAFVGVTIGEYHIQSQIALCKLKTTELVGLDGKTTNAYDAISLVNGRLHIDPNFEQAWNKAMPQTVLDVRNIIKHTQGNHSDQDKVALEKEWMGATILQFHRWVYNGFKNRWGRASFDEGIGITTEGYYHGLIRLAKAIKVFGFKMSTYENMSEHDKALVRMALQEFKYVASLLCLIIIGGALKPKPDDDEKHLLYLSMNLAERVLSGTMGELNVFSNPLEVYALAKNPVAGLGMLRDFGVLLKNTAQAPYYLATGNEDKLNYQTGSRKGDSKLWKSTKDLIPILRMDRIWEQLQTTGTPWIQ
jgi:hypothetical protein